MAHLTVRLEDGDEEAFHLALRHVVEAQEVGQDDDGLRFCMEGWMRLRALMTQAIVYLPQVHICVNINQD